MVRGLPPYLPCLAVPRQARPCPAAPSPAAFYLNIFMISHNLGTVCSPVIFNVVSRLANKDIAPSCALNAIAVGLLSFGKLLGLTEDKILECRLAVFRICRTA